MIESCTKCESGILHVLPKDNKNASYFVFRCDCVLGGSRTENYPKWDQRMMFRWISHKKYWNDQMLVDKKLAEKKED